MARLTRLDVELVRRSLATSRQEAQELINAGHVLVDAMVANKPARQVNPACAIVIKTPADKPSWVSRGAHKLLGALEHLGQEAPKIDAAVCLDAGASTGGFTQVLLRAGAARVYAVDVGYGQLAWKIRENPRVTVMERTNVRGLTGETFTDKPTLVVGDLSFISLRLVLPALVAAAHPQADYLLMVKPQFEVGKGQVGKGGVVRDGELHVSAVAAVTERARELGLGLWAVAPSPLPGPAGNVEYFVALRAGHPRALPENEAMQAIRRAVETGPLKWRSPEANV